MLDWLRLAGLNDSVPLDIDRHPPGGRIPAWETIRTHLAANGYRVLTLVAEDHGRILGLGQTGPRDSVWHVARLMTRGDAAAADATRTLTSLLTGLIQAAAERGAVRMHAHVERQAAANEAFARTGFAPFSYESVYWLPKQPEQPTAGAAPLLRPQESKDGWGVYQLYCAVTPRVVQQAEGLDSSYWEIPSAAAMRALRRVGEQRWVVEQEGEIVGHVRANRLSRRLHIMVHPQAYAHARAMIAQGVGAMYPTRAIHCCLPEYQGELGIALEEEGFRFLGTQVAFVKQLAAPVRAESRVLRPVLEPKLGQVHSASRHS